MRLFSRFDCLKPGPSRPPARSPGYGASPRCWPSRRLSVEAFEDRSVPASLAVGDVIFVEGNAGTQYAEVRVSLDAPSNRTVTVNYGTANGTATAGSDYYAVSGNLAFAPGETSKTVLVPVTGDRLGEPDETFLVKLHGAKNAKLADGTGVVTLVDNEPRISISGAASSEGNAGTTLLTFTVSLSAVSDEPVTIHYATQDGTAIAGEDYLATSGTLTFAPGETTKTITVEVLGDTTPEPTETFYVLLSGASANASIAAFYYASGGILDDDGYPGEPCMENCGTDGDGGYQGTAP